MGVGSQLRDQGLRATANALYKDRFGELLTLNLNTADRHLIANVRLLGESESIQISGHYRLVESTEGTRLHIDALQISRPWLHNLVAALASEKPLSIPLEGLLGRMASMVLKGGF